MLGRGKRRKPAAGISKGQRGAELPVKAGLRHTDRPLCIPSGEQLWFWMVSVSGSRLWKVNNRLSAVLVDSHKNSAFFSVFCAKSRKNLEAAEQYPHYNKCRKTNWPGSEKKGVKLWQKRKNKGLRQQPGRNYRWPGISARNGGCIPWWRSQFCTMLFLSMFRCLEIS